MKDGFAERPVNFVTFHDALRFANWLTNGQPVGAQGSGTTETGAYTITPASEFDNSITRNPGFGVFLASEDEWYKAAYYDAVSTTYFDYPLGSDTPTSCALASPLPGTANCDNEVGTTSEKGAYSGSTSPFGTFDQAGNVFEWNEAIIEGTTRGLRGGDWFSDPANQEAGFRTSADPTTALSTLGFRLVQIVPEPGTGMLLAAGLIGLAARRRR